MTNNNIYFVANWKMYGNLTSLNALNKVINISRSSFSKKQNLFIAHHSHFLINLSKKQETQRLR